MKHKEVTKNTYYAPTVVEFIEQSITYEKVKRKAFNKRRHDAYDQVVQVCLLNGIPLNQGTDRRTMHRWQRTTSARVPAVERFFARYNLSTRSLVRWANKEKKLLKLWT